MPSPLVDPTSPVQTFGPRRRLLAALVGVSLGALTGLRAVAQTRDSPLKVVASFSILADWARQLGGDRVEVHALVGPDGDAHVYSPGAADARRLSQADLVLVSGLHFEGWMDRLVKSSGFRGPVVTVSRGIAPLSLDGGPDPHYWQDVRLARTAVAAVRDAYLRARPEESKHFETLAHRYEEALAALDEEIRQRWSSVPEGGRRVVTTHDAFGYYARAYGVSFLAAQGWSTEKEASAAQVARLIRQLRQQEVRAVFVENMTQPRLMQRVAQEGGATIGGTLYADALSPAGGPAPDYLRMMRHNTEALVSALTAARP